MIKGVIFDKDGTLIDFFSLWLTAAQKTIPAFLEKNGIEPTREMQLYLLETIGVWDDKVDPKGALAYKSYWEIAEDMCNALKEKEIELDVEEVQYQIEDLFVENVTGKHIQYQEFISVETLAKTLKDSGIAVGMATADTLHSAEVCLEKLHALDLFDYVAGDDGVLRPKPEPDMFEQFREQTGLKAEEIAVVGDAYNDMVFAKQNGGIAIGVLSGVCSREDFGEKADYIIESVRELPKMIAEINEKEHILTEKM